MMEPRAVKSVSLKFAVVKSAVGRSSNSPVETARPTVEPAAWKSAATVKPSAVNSPATMNSSTAMRSCPQRTRLQERGGKEQCS
jgi:hypothetical protein